MVVAEVALGALGVSILVFRAVASVLRTRRLSEGRWGETLAAFGRATRRQGPRSYTDLT
jgi:hypothetical protein